MLNPFGIRHRRLLAPNPTPLSPPAGAVYAFFLEGDVVAQTAVLEPQLLFWNPETLGSGLDFSLRIDASLDLGSTLTDPLESGLYTANVVPLVTIPAGTLKGVPLADLTNRWISSYAGVSSSWKVKHQITLTNLHATLSTRAQLLVTGLFEDVVPAARLPLFNLNSPAGT